MCWLFLFLTTAAAAATTTTSIYTAQNLVQLEYSKLIHVHTGTRTYKYTHYTQFATTDDKQGLSAEGDRRTERKRLKVIFERVQRFVSERKVKVSPCRGVEDGKGSGTNSKKSGTKNLEAESIRSRAESTGGCIKMKTVAETSQSGEYRRVYKVEDSRRDKSERRVREGV